jgi:V/A-type H+-transporting ATPase subunit K
MDSGLLGQLGIMASFGFSALGSAVGVGVVGTATIGAWKKCFIQNKPVPFILVAFAGVPLSNVIYGFILMNALASSEILNNYQLLFLGLFGGMGIGVTAYTQARCAACASEAFAETGQGFGNYMMIIGICETVALFVMVLSILLA